jgi:two-component system, chemotaxis family, chemotaxis protein CheY
MPNLDGAGLLQRVKSDCRLKSIPFVMIASAADRQSVTGAIQAGAVGFIVKPFAIATTSRTLEKVLREIQARLMEPVSQAARRLSIGKSEVTRLMRKLQTDVSSCADLLEKEGAAESHLPEIQRMQGSCSLLGLKHCASLLMFDPANIASLEAECLSSLREVELQITFALDAALQEA